MCRLLKIKVGSISVCCFSFSLHVLGVVFVDYAPTTHTHERRCHCELSSITHEHRLLPYIRTESSVPCALIERIGGRWGGRGWSECLVGLGLGLTGGILCSQSACLQKLQPKRNIVQPKRRTIKSENILSPSTEEKNELPY